MSLTEKAAAFAATAGNILVPESARTGLRATTKRLGAFDYPFALECHLADAAGRVDLTVRIHPELRDAILKNRFVISDAVTHFLKKWADPNGPLAAIPYLELEFDINGEVCDPWFGPAVEPFVARGPSGIYREARKRPELRAQRVTLSKHVLANLPVTPPTNALLNRLALAYDALPALGSINHIGALAARRSAPKEGIRLILSLPRYALATYLADVGWQGDLERLDRELDGLKPLTERVDLDLYLDNASAGDTMAIYNEYRAPRKANSALAKTLERLRSMGYLDASQKEAVANWIAAVDGDSSRVLTFKLSWQKDAPTIAKLYLSQLR